MIPIGHHAATQKIRPEGTAHVVFAVCVPKQGIEIRRPTEFEWPLLGRSEKSGAIASFVARRAANGRSNTAVEWKAFQFHRTLLVRSNPDQDKQSTELRNTGGFAERNARM